MNILMRVNRKQSIQPLLFAAVVGVLATGCSTYQQQNHVIQYWRQNNLTNAVAEATKMADKNANNKDAIIWRLEQGAVLRGAGKYEESNKAFDQAQDKIDQYAQKAKVRVGQEAGAMMSNHPGTATAATAAAAAPAAPCQLAALNSSGIFLIEHEKCRQGHVGNFLFAERHFRCGRRITCRLHVCDRSAGRCRGDPHK